MPNGICGFLGAMGKGGLAGDLGLLACLLACLLVWDVLSVSRAVGLPTSYLGKKGRQIKQSAPATHPRRSDGTDWTDGEDGNVLDGRDRLDGRHRQDGR